MNKTRPGVYVNVKGSKPLAIEVGARGIAVLPLVLPYGKEKDFIKIRDISDITNKLGINCNHESMITIKEALKNAFEVNVYRVNIGTKAKVTIGTITAEARYSGAYANGFNLKITKENENFLIQVFDNGVEVDTQRISVISEYALNNYITFDGEGELEAANVNLAGGTDGTTAIVDYTDCFEACKLIDFNVIGYCGSDTTTINKLIDYVKNQRDVEFKKIVGVYASSTNQADHEGLVVVANGVILDDDTIISKEKAVAYVTGASAGASISQSNTFKIYQGAKDVDVRMTNIQIENAIKSGLFVFSVRGYGKVVSEYDINSLVTYTAEKLQSFSKNKVVRVIDSVANDIKSIFEGNFVGKHQNNDGGRNVLKGMIAEYLLALQNQGAIENFAPEDIVIIKGSTSDSVNVTLVIQPTDTIDKIYVNVEVR